jgi:hypothetical protein
MDGDRHAINTSGDQGHHAWPHTASGMFQARGKSQRLAR